jgi:hypothetical protein
MIRRTLLGVSVAVAVMAFPAGRLDAGGQGPTSSSGGGSSFGGGQSSSFSGDWRPAGPFSYARVGTNFESPLTNGRTMTGGFIGFGFPPPSSRFQPAATDPFGSRWGGFSPGYGYPLPVAPKR